MSDLKKLYSEIIRQHNESPVHFEKIEHATHTLKAYNPVCGDRFDLYLACNENMISEIHFHGFGCAVSKASTSILVKLLEGKSLNQARTLCDQFLGFINGEMKDDPSTLPGDFRAFSGVLEFPERRDCATLPWSEMKKFLEGLNSKN